MSRTRAQLAIRWGSLAQLYRLVANAPDRSDGIGDQDREGPMQQTPEGNPGGGHAKSQSRPQETLREQQHSLIGALPDECEEGLPLRRFPSAEDVAHPGLEFTTLIAQPPPHRHGTIVVRFDLARFIQVILEARWSNEGQRPSIDLSFIAIAVFGEWPVVAEEDDAELLRVSIMEPVVDAPLCRLVTKDRVVRLHEEVAPLKPGKLLDAADVDGWSSTAMAGSRSRLPPAEQRFETLELGRWRRCHSTQRRLVGHKGSPFAHHSRE
jgi:hypothetical protein